MASSGIRMVVKFENVKDPQKFKEAFKECIDSTRKEAGCLMYELFEESVNPTEGAFTVLEWWESQDAIDAHLKSAHIAAFHVKAVTLLGGKPELKYYKSVGL